MRGRVGVRAGAVLTIVGFSRVLVPVRMTVLGIRRVRVPVRMTLFVVMGVAVPVRMIVTAGGRVVVVVPVRIAGVVLGMARAITVVRLTGVIAVGAGAGCGAGQRRRSGFGKSGHIAFHGSVSNETGAVLLGTGRVWCDSTPWSYYRVKRGADIAAPGIRGRSHEDR